MLFRSNHPSPSLPVESSSVADPVTKLFFSNQLLIETKTRLIDSIQNDIANRLVFSFNSRERCLKISAQHHDTRKEESISIDKLKKYLSDAQNEFFSFNSPETFEEGYFFLRKLSALLRFYQKKTHKSGIDKEVLVCMLNEIVFLSSHGVIPKIATSFAEAFTFLKLQFPKAAIQLPSISVFSHKTEFFEGLRKKIYKNKVQLRLLLASCLFYSEIGAHEKANTQANSALSVIIDLLKLSSVISHFYLVKNLLRSKGNKPEKNESSHQLSIFYFANIVVILNTLFKSLEGFFVVNPQKSVERYLNLFNEILKKENFVLPEIDFSLLNNESIVGNIFLLDSTILSLTQMNFFNFEDDFVNQKLKSEATEISVLEKIAYLVVVLYILSTESRLKEHQNIGNLPLFKVLYDSCDLNGKPKLSEIFLTKATEVSYLFLSENFPFVSQIFSMFKKFDLGRSKVIPESLDDPVNFIFLNRFKNGFRNNSIVPVIMLFDQTKLGIVSSPASKKSKVESQQNISNSQKEGRLTPHLDKLKMIEKKPVVKEPRALQEVIVRNVKTLKQSQKIYQHFQKNDNVPKSQNFIEDNIKSETRASSSTTLDKSDIKKRGNSSKISEKRSSEKVKDRRANSSETSKNPFNANTKILSKTMINFPSVNPNDFKAAKSGQGFFKKVPITKTERPFNQKNREAKVLSENMPPTQQDFLKKGTVFQNVNIHVNNIKTMNFVMGNEVKSPILSEKIGQQSVGLKTRTIQDLIRNIN